jgi:hypothetical protein
MGNTIETVPGKRYARKLDKDFDEIIEALDWIDALVADAFQLLAEMQVENWLKDRDTTPADS